MVPRFPSLWSGALLALLAAPSSAASGGNILLILVDDVGVDKVGAYGAVTNPPPPSTPNIDALAAQGVRFLNAYSYPICAPSRAALQTGRFGFRNGIGGNLGNTLPKGPFVVPPYAVTPGGVGNPLEVLDLDEVILPEALDRGGSGYAHAFFGKWHLGHADFLAVPGHASNHGYGEFAGTRGNFPPRTNPPENYFFWTRVANGASKHTTQYNTSAEVDDALAWISKQQDAPWFCVVSFNAPHGPLHRPPGSSLPNPVPKGKEAAWPYYNEMVEYMDAEIERLLEGVAAAGFGLLDDVTVVLMGDNGTDSDPRGPRQLVFPPFDPTRSKGTVYEGGTHVPLIVAGRAVSQPGRTSSALVSIVDIFATVAELAGVDLDDPAVIPPTTQLDSVSFVPVLKDPTHPGNRDVVFTETFGPNNPGGVVPGNRALRDARYKLVEIANGTPAVVRELYDLWLDPHETNDLLASGGVLSPPQAKAYGRLRGALTALLASE